MGVITAAWWILFFGCVVGLVWTRGRKARRGATDSHQGTGSASDGADAPASTGPRLPAALQDGAAAARLRRRTFSDFDRDVLAPLLMADVGPDGVRCPGCVDGSVRRYLHRSRRDGDEVRGDVWCASCRRHTTLSGAGAGVDFDDPLAHLDEARRAEIALDLDEYLGGLDLLWTQGTLPQQLRRGSTAI